MGVVIMLSYFPLLRELADIWAMITVGFLLGCGCIVGAWFLPPLRQIFAGLAVACFASTFMFGAGVKQERDVCAAREARAELLRQERDRLQAKLAGDDGARRAAGLDELNRKEMESDNDFAKRISTKVSCTITDDDLR